MRGPGTADVQLDSELLQAARPESIISSERQLSDAVKLWMTFLIRGIEHQYFSSQSSGKLSFHLYYKSSPRRYLIRSIKFLWKNWYIVRNKIILKHRTTFFFDSCFSLCPKLPEWIWSQWWALFILSGTPVGLACLDFCVTSLADVLVCLINVWNGIQHFGLVMWIAEWHEISSPCYCCCGNWQSKHPFQP